MSKRWRVIAFSAFLAALGAGLAAGGVPAPLVMAITSVVEKVVGPVLEDAEPKEPPNLQRAPAAPQPE